MRDIKQITVKLDGELLQQLDDVARFFRLSRADIVRLACSDLLSGKRIVDMKEIRGGGDTIPVPVVMVDP